MLRVHRVLTVLAPFAFVGALYAQTGPRPAAVCNYSLSSSSLSIHSPGGAGSVDVLTSAGCGWTASTDASWLTITSGGSNTGPGTIGFNVASNSVAASRIGHLTVQGQVLTVTQIAVLGPDAQVQQIWTSAAQTADTTNALSCTGAPSVTTTFTPTDAAAYVFVFATNVSAGNVISTEYYAPDGTLYANAGGSYTVPTDVRIVCHEDQGMKVNGAPAASKPGVWGVNVKVNGVLVITTNFTILGTSSCTYTLSATSVSVTSVAANGFSINVNTGAGCAWTASSNVLWIIVTANASGVGSGTVLYAVVGNPGDSRTGYLTIAGQPVAITQVALFGPLTQVTDVRMTNIPFLNTITPCGSASPPVTAFAPTDAAAYMFVFVAGISAGDVLSDQYFAPDGTLYGNAGGTITVPVPGNQFGCWQDPGLTIRGTPAANLTGTWNVRVFVNGTLEITLTFTMLGGSNCSYSLNSTASTVGAAGGTGTVAVSADPGCSWTAATSTSWIHITSGSSGIGPGSVGYSVDVNSGSARTAALQIAGQTFTVTEASGLSASPSITQNGVADPWTYTTGVAPGAWVSIFGSNLSNSTQIWSPAPGDKLPTALANVGVTIDGMAAVLAYVSPTQVNALAPAGIRTGPIQIVVTNNGLTSQPYVIQGTTYLPAIYSNAAPGSSPARYYVTAVDPVTGQLLGNVSTDPRVVRAPRAGDTIDLYGSGLGPSTPFPTDISFTGAYPLVSNPNVSVGGIPITPSFAALVAPGLYQVRVTLPATLAPGDQPILLDFGGGVQSAQNVFLSIQR